jgi:hypothetical protein
MDIKLASEYSINNREQIKASEKAGCYCCLSIFSPKDINKYYDNGMTALCPKCGIDSVIGSKSGYPINLEILQKMHHCWF